MNKKAEYGGWVIFLLIIIVLMAIGWAFTGNFIKEKDSDNDGLSDEEELKMGTDPNNQNTDGDRYLDGDDREPLKKNSALISQAKINIDEEYHEFTILKDGVKIIAVSGTLLGCGSMTLGACASASLPVLNSINNILEDSIYTSSGEFILQNIGDDYTEYLTFDIVYSINNEILYIAPMQSGKLLQNKRISIPYSYDFKIKDMKYILWDIFLNNKKIDVKIENLKYEQYS